MYDLEPGKIKNLGLNTARLNTIPNYFQSGYLDTGKLPCVATLVSRHGEIAHEAYRGTMEMGSGAPIGPDTLFRIYSMTKPITAVAALMLFEAGEIRLDHPVSRYIPEFAHVRVWAGGDLLNYGTTVPERPMTLRDLFLHTSGLTYGFLAQHEVDALYRREKIGRPDETLSDFCKRLAALPLVCSPGARWNYGHSTDVLGHIIELVSGQSLDVFFRTRIFQPLQMLDTDFYVPEAKRARLPACYAKSVITGEVGLYDGAGEASKQFLTQPLMLNAGGGLVSTLQDYHRFCLMLLQGGKLGDARLLSPKTVEFMRLNHLPKNQTLKDMGDKTFSEARMEGNGFGLAGSVVVNVTDTQVPGSLGNVGWGGLASTFFWIDWEEKLIGLQATQMMPSSAYPIRPQFQQLVYAALED